MKKQINIALAGISVLSSGWASAKSGGNLESPPDYGREQPNIIIFLTDDQGWGDLGVYGHSSIKTPNLDKFAREGMLFTNCHSGSAVCSPSRAAILTGRTPFRNGVYTIHLTGNDFSYLRNEEITLPEVLKKNGYATCHVGKWHLGSFKPEMGHPKPRDINYDYWFAAQSNAKPSHLNPVNFVRNGEPTGMIEGYSSGIIVNEAIQWLENERPKNNPFFLSVWTHEPHTPIGTATEFLKLYDEKLDPVVRNYYGNITQMDHAFGFLMDWLDNSGEKDNTLVIFTSDNGPAWAPGHLDRVQESSGYHRGAKAWLYEGGIRVPGIIRYPKMIKAGTVSHECINGTDYFPTILDMLDIPLPENRVIDGISILPVLEENKPLPEREVPLYWRYIGSDDDLKIAYREGDWVLLADNIIDRCELYNLAEDWQQSNNLVYAPAFYDRFAAMKKRLVQLHEEIEKEGPNEWWDAIPDNLMHWKRHHPEGIERHLQGEIPEEKPEPYNDLIVE
jgi:arylsulfatase A